GVRTTVGGLARLTFHSPLCTPLTDGVFATFTAPTTVTTPVPGPGTGCTWATRPIVTNEITTITETMRAISPPHPSMDCPSPLSHRPSPSIHAPPIAHFPSPIPHPH